MLLKLNEGHSHESDPDDDYEMSSDDDEDSAKYINASLISVRLFKLRSRAVAAVFSFK